MSVVVVTPASDQLLVTRDRVKLELGLLDATQDARIDALVAECSDEIARRCGRVFGYEEVTEKMNGSGRQRLVLSRTPIVEILEVRVNGSVLDPAGYVVEDAGAGFLFASAGWLRSTLLGGLAFQDPSTHSSEAIYEVDYTGGYWLPNWATPGSPLVPAPEVLPPSLGRFALDYVCSQYARAAKDRGVKSYSLGDYSVTFDSDSEEKFFERLASFTRLDV